MAKDQSSDGTSSQDYDDLSDIRNHYEGLNRKHSQEDIYEGLEDQRTYYEM